MEAALSIVIPGKCSPNCGTSIRARNALRFALLLLGLSLVINTLEAKMEDKYAKAKKKLSTKLAILM
jgi:hypothetical protein